MAEGPVAGITYACVTASMSTKVLAEAGNKSNLTRQLTGFITGVVNNPNNPDERGTTHLFVTHPKVLLTKGLSRTRT
jgi:hypothetical protein